VASVSRPWPEACDEAASEAQSQALPCGRSIFDLIAVVSKKLEIFCKHIDQEPALIQHRPLFIAFT